MSKAMVRAQRSSRRVPKGREILEFLTAAKTRKRLVATAAEGEPPVAAISHDLAKLVGPKDLALAQLKQFVGICVRAILEEEGYEIERTGVWLGSDPVFSTGAVYRQVATRTQLQRDDWLERLAKMLNDDEADKLAALLSRRKRR
jgi:hypothetical protein